MKAINIGETYTIHKDSVKTFDRLPTKTYYVKFTKMQGYFLEETKDIAIKEKMYGDHTKKAEKVIRKFNNISERNLGVILSGDKGIGKSLTAKNIAILAIENDIPVLIINEFIPSISSYLESIDQKVMVLFDEFDKTFSTHGNDDNCQNEMLSLFDGLSQGQKLFVITCNKLDKLSEFLVNRPGRFHYHFRFGYPASGEIREYLSDKILPEYREEIDKVIVFSSKVSLNYDCLRSIASEINDGECFEEAIKDLNILNTKNECYDAYLVLENGEILNSKCNWIDLFDDELRVSLRDKKSKEYVGTVKFNSSKIIYDEKEDAIDVDANDFIDYFIDDYLDDDLKKRYENIKPSKLVLKKQTPNSMHYEL